jgi:hypothetical protein
MYTYKTNKMNKRNATNIADWIEYWDHFDEDLHAQYLLASQFKIKKPMNFKTKDDNISRVVNRYFRMRRNKILRKIFFFYSK